MSEAALTRTWDVNAAARSALQASAIAWLVPTLVGQWFFAWHIADVYIKGAITGDFTAWTDRLFVGLVAGDTVGNAALAAHLFIAFFITVGGTLQLIPLIRSRAPAFHRWNGRAYIVMAFVTSVAALYMIWTRETFGGTLYNDLVQSLNALLIMIFAAIAWRHAKARRIAVHQRWALRTFVVVSGVWSMRIIYAFLGTLVDPIPGVTDDMKGPTNMAIAFAAYALPLAILELWFLARRNPGPAARFATAALLFTAAAVTTVGAYARTVRWLTETW